MKLPATRSERSTSAAWRDRTIPSLCGRARGRSRAARQGGRRRARATTATRRSPILHPAHDGEQHVDDEHDDRRRGRLPSSFGSRVRLAHRHESRIRERCRRLLSDAHGGRRASLRGDEVAVPVVARLGHPFERLEVDLDDAEPARVAERPLEVVEQRPDEVAAHRDTALDRIPSAPRWRSRYETRCASGTLPLARSSGNEAPFSVMYRGGSSYSSWSRTRRSVARRDRPPTPSRCARRPRPRRVSGTVPFEPDRTTFRV